MVKKVLFFGIVCFFATISVANAQTYDPTNVAVINALITNNGLEATPDAPETWDFAIWNDETPKQIIRLNLYERNMIGAASFAGLNSLEFLWCTDNNLSELDVSNNSALERLECDSNTLSELDVSNNLTLETLYCDSNNLSELDISNNLTLGWLICGSNNLSQLDVTSNTALRWLFCEYNNLSELDVTNNAALSQMKCTGNKLSYVDLSNINSVWQKTTFFKNRGGEIHPAGSFFGKFLRRFRKKSHNFFALSIVNVKFC